MFAAFSKAFFDVLKLAPRYLIGVAVIAGVLLFLPAEHLSAIGVDQFAKLNRQWLGLAFLVSAILWGVAMLGHMGTWFKKILARRAIRKRVVRKLQALTEDEKQILRYYVAKNTRSNRLRVDDGVVKGLVSDRIIYMSSNLGTVHDGFAHNIHDFAWDYIHENVEVLQGTTNTYRSDEGRWFR
jgi:hypothetical protein